MARAGKLRLFEVTVNKPYSGSDTRLVPGASLSVAIHRQGATAAETKTILTTDTTLAVRDTGALRIGETIQLNTTAASTMQVVSIDSRIQVTIKSTTGSSIAVSSGDRLVPTTKPTIYSDATGAASTTNALTTNTQGYASCYVYEQAVDYIVSGTGYTTLLIRDFRTGAIDSVFNVLDYGAVGDGTTDDEAALNRLFDQVALLASDEGLSTVYFPRGNYYIKSPLVPDGENVTGAVVGLQLRGEDGAKITAATTAAGGAWTTTSRMAILSFRNSTDANKNWSICGLELDGSSVGAVGGATTLAGIVTAEITNLRLEDLYIHDFGDPAIGTGSSYRNDGIILGDDIGDASSARATDVLIKNCRIVNCVRNGITLSDTQDVHILDTYIENADNFGISLAPDYVFQNALSITITGCDFYNVGTTAINAIPAVALQGVNYSDQYESLRVRDCYINGNDATVTGIAAGNWIGVTVSGCDIHHVQTYGLYLRSVINLSIVNCDIADITVTSASYGIFVSSGLTVQSAIMTVLGNRIKAIDGYGVYVTDVDGGGINNNIIDDCDNASGGYDGIRVDRTSATSRRITLTGNVCTNSATGSGIRLHSASVSDCILAHNIALGNGGTYQIYDAGTNTHWGPNVTGSLVTHTSTAHGGPITVGAPPGGGASAWGGQFSAAAATSTTITNGNVKSGARIICTPASQVAANNVSAFFVSSTSDGSFKVGHANALTQRYNYLILNQ